jgi:2'-5' RNA ligase
VSALAGAVGFEPERRALRPHVTVARARRGPSPRAAGLDPPPPALSFEPEALVLYRSHTGAGGARYEPLVRVPGV